MEFLRKSMAIVLAGGEGSRLSPLTNERAKPAVPFGGKYRIIDFTLSNCMHSGVRRVLVLTQYKSHSLQKHLRDGWSIFNPELGEYITAVPPQMRTGENWYRGTADAVFQNSYLLERSEAEYVVILAGDHIYRMDYSVMIQHHVQNGALMTIAAMKVPLDEARAFGVMQVAPPSSWITSFEEKPDQPEPCFDDPEQALASMGIYVFSKKLLLDVLYEDAANSQSSHDFGKDIIPKLIKQGKVCCYPFGGSSGRVEPDSYWRDVGTIDAYFQANMDLLKPVPPLNLYQKDWHIRTYNSQNPPARTVIGASGECGCTINSILASGAVVAGGKVENAILFDNAVVEDQAYVSESVLFPGVVVGSGAKLKRCIVEKHVHIPPNIEIGFDLEKDKQRFSVSQGGVVVLDKYSFR